jgi:hypothetical protein
MNAYASHLPVLQSFGHLNIHRVLELGAGKFSTTLFLDREAFPVLVRLDSYEDDPHWRNLIHRTIDDKRLRSLSQYARLDPDDYDLILIDSGRSADERITAIQHIVSLNTKAIVIIHDYDNPYYQAVTRFEHIRIYSQLTPWTAVCWNGEREEVEQLCTFT